MKLKGRCLWFVRRPKGSRNSENVPKEAIKDLEDKYDIKLKDLLKNTKDCNNQDMPKGSNTTIHLPSESSRYPPCYFGLSYVTSGGPDYPIWEPQNAEDLPDWVNKGNDQWNGARDAICDDDDYKDAPACSWS